MVTSGQPGSLNPSNHTTAHNCLPQECQDQADRATLVAMAVPICLAVAAAAYVARPPPQELKDSGQVFEDDSTGFLFEVSEADAEPERDKDVSGHTGPGSAGEFRTLIPPWWRCQLAQD